MSMISMLVNHVYVSILIVVFALVGCDTRTEEQKYDDEAAERYKKGMELRSRGDSVRSIAEIFESAKMGNEQASDELVRLIGNGEIPYNPYGSRAVSLAVRRRFEIEAQNGDVSAKRTYAKFLVKKAIEDESNMFLFGPATIKSANENLLREAYDYVSEVVAAEQNPEDKNLLNKIKGMFNDAVREKNRKMCVELRKMRENYLELMNSLRDLNEKSETMTYAQYKPIRAQWLKKVSGTYILVRGRVKDVFVNCPVNFGSGKTDNSAAVVVLDSNDGFSIRCYGYPLSMSVSDAFAGVAKTLNKKQEVSIIGAYDAELSTSSEMVVKNACLILEDLFNMALKIEDGKR